MPKMNFYVRHLIVGLIAFALSAPFWYGRLDWDPEMRLWRAVGDGSFLLLFFTMVIGPLARLWPAVRKLVPWRRETGIWYGLLALYHTWLVWDGWARWDIMRLFGYEFIPELSRLARLEPGFGLSNAIGLAAVFLTLFLVATSSEWAINLLGASGWKWLQYGSYTVYYLVIVHALYFLFIHYTVSFHRSVPPNPNWFRYPFLGLALIVPGLQFAAFFKTVFRRYRNRGQNKTQQTREGHKVSV